MQVTSMQTRVMVPFSYFSLPMQKQFLRNREAIRGKPYARFSAAICGCRYRPCAYCNKGLCRGSRR